jgi:hypothetical protein
MTFPHRRLYLAAGCAAFVLMVACGDSEAPSAEDHTPVSYRVLIDSVDTNPPFTLTAGQSVRFQVKFANAAHQDLDFVQNEHFGGLTFNPTSLATVTRDPDFSYRFTVVPGSAGTGTVQISFGHDEAADEVSFDPVAVTVEPAAP